MIGAIIEHAAGRSRRSALGGLVGACAIAATASVQAATAPMERISYETHIAAFNWSQTA